MWNTNIVLWTLHFFGDLVLFTRSHAANSEEPVSNTIVPNELLANNVKTAPRH